MKKSVSKSWMGRAMLQGAGLLLGAALMTGCGGAPDDAPAVEAPAVEMEQTGAKDDALTDTYTKTKYPVVLCHGMAGFDTLFGVMDYFNGIDTAIKSGGAKVFVTHVPAFGATEARGEALLAQVEDIIAVTGAKKVNLIGHSHGGLDVRYVASVRPDLIASVTSVGSPHKGAELADYLRDNMKQGGFTEGVVSFFADSLGTVIGLCSGNRSEQDSVAALASLSSAGSDAFNSTYPAGVPASACGQGSSSVNGVRYYSWSGTSVLTNVLDTGDGPLGLTSLFYEEDNDGLVGRCSSHLGEVVRDDYSMNHLDEVNQLFGFTALFSTSPKTVFRAHVNRLKNAGL
jgi:triacylglycerol lipase